MNRRAFISKLLEIPAAALAVLRPKGWAHGGIVPKGTPMPVHQCGCHSYMRICFNCHTPHMVSKWLPGGVTFSDVWIDPATPGVLRLVNYSTGSPQLRSGGIHQDATVSLCDQCIEAIRWCATCGCWLPDENQKFSRGGVPRISRASEPINPMAWPLPLQPDVLGATGKRGARGEWIPDGMYLVKSSRAGVRLTLDEVHAKFGVRPANHALIVADCPACHKLRSQIDEAQRNAQSTWTAA